MFEFETYRLKDGKTVNPAKHGLIELSRYPSTDITQDDIIVALYRYNRTPVTFKGSWNQKANGWVFDMTVGLSDEGEEVKQIIEKIKGD